ncbi:glutamine synthetase 1, mitochondrial [Lutzomyia longipalpis]|uniref:Glutamine synthetase n=2 Tax=Lutzomyia longipalpis TaxID=7200 RepID=A0A7G3AD86_LUTLO|nr:glutamine synthetase 1, mitochondrial [Lutzomyia longipalpis]
MALRVVGLLIRQEMSTLTSKAPSRMFSSTPRALSSVLANSPNADFNKKVMDRYSRLQLNPNVIQATYVWIDGTGENVRSKTRILNKKPESPAEVPKWSYDGSSTYQALGGNSDTTLVPRAIYKDPTKFGVNDIIVMCDTYKPDGTPCDTNHRCAMQHTMDKIHHEEPWFGIEQEYTFLDFDNRPLGWPAHGFPGPQGPYYCGVGADRVIARDIVEAHGVACIYAGIDFAGTNAEVMPAQWEYQVGPSLGMKCADDLWVSRYLLWRIAEDYGVVVTFDPKPMDGPWNGAGAHTNFSTRKMREDGGMKVIEQAIERLSKKQDHHIRCYDPHGGKDNERRLIGRLETSSIKKFSWGIADRGVSVRVPRGVADAGKGYLEDRRPSSNCDPYAVCNAILDTCCVDK